MPLAILIALSFTLGFFVESIIGFGGGLIAYSILGFFIDIKTVIIAGLYIGTCSSLHIALSDRKSFQKSTFISLIPICLAGTIIGVFIFSGSSSRLLLTILGGLLILLSIRNIFFDHLHFPKSLRNFLLLSGGIMHGAFGLGGPFVINAISKEFETKSHLRTTMAVFFVGFNVVRIIQLSIQGQIQPQLIFSVWWAVLPVFIAIYLGHKVHLAISETTFKKLISAMTLFAGIMFLLK